jgi:fatty acid desaturase
MTPEASDAGRRENSPSPGRSEPRPAALPEPTFWPAVLAFSACFALWGVLTSPWMILMGTAGTVLAALMWLAEVQHEPSE